MEAKFEERLNRNWEFQAVKLQEVKDSGTRHPTVG
jgi:hypothetical protein